MCVQYLGYGDTKYFGKQAKNKIWPYSPYRDDKMNEGQKRRLKAFDVAVIEADVIVSCSSSLEKTQKDGRWTFTGFCSCCFHRCILR